LALVLLSLLVRPFGLIALAAGVGGLRARSGGEDGHDALRGLGWKAPWSTAALVVGSLSIAGMPVSAGFVWRWALYRELVSAQPGAVPVFLLAGVGVMAGVWRGLSILLMRPAALKDRSIVPLDSSEGWLTAAVVVVAILACVGVGLFPQVIASLAASLAEAYNCFSF